MMKCDRPQRDDDDERKKFDHATVRDELKKVVLTAVLASSCPCPKCDRVKYISATYAMMLTVLDESIDHPSIPASVFEECMTAVTDILRKFVADHSELGLEPIPQAPNKKGGGK